MLVLDPEIDRFSGLRVCACVCVCVCVCEQNYRSRSSFGGREGGKKRKVGRYLEREREREKETQISEI